MNKLLQWNVNGIRTRNDDLNILITEHQPDIICLSETKLTPNIPFNCKGYNLHRKDRNPVSEGGGLLTLTKNSIGAKVINFPNSKYDREYLIVETIFNSKTITYISIYDNNGHGNAKSLENLINDIQGTKFIIGDFNSRSTTWGAPYTTHAGDLLNNCFNNCDLCLLNDGKPTYLNPKTRNSSILDLSLCTADIYPNIKWESHHTGTSDHDPIIIKYTPDNSTWTNQRKTWRIRNANWKKYKEQLNNQEITITPEDINIEENAQNFTNIIIQAAEKSIGMKTQKPNTRPSPPWWNKDVQKAIKMRNTAKNKARRSTNLNDYVQYKKLVATAKRLTMYSRDDSWNKFMETVTPYTAARIVWRKAKNLTTQSNYSYPTLIKKDFSIATTDMERAAALLEPLDIHLQDDDTARNLNNLFNNYQTAEYDNYNTPLTTHELNKAIKTLRDGAPGPDLIHNSFLRNLTPKYKETLLFIFNQCWENGQIPEIWKSSNMLPILKKGKDPSNPENYRPIMLSSCTLKLYEKIIAKRYTHFMEVNNLIPNYQYGFRKGMGCEEALDSLTADIKTASARGQYTICAFIDAKGAFNNCRKEAILASLREINTPLNIYKFCIQYLTNRSYFMTIGISTAKITTSHGVPQGGVMAPHLFTTVMNHIPPKPNNDISPGLYADDCKLHSSNISLKKAAENVNKALESINQNAKTWDITFDPNKSKVVIFYSGKKRKIDTDPISIKLDNQDIEIVKSHKFLGIIYDQHLNWKEQTEAIQKKCQINLNLLKSVANQRWGNSQKAAKLLYFSLIRSRITYGITSYGDQHNKYFDKLVKVQNQAIRIALGVPPGSANAAIHMLSNIPHLSDYRDYLLLKNACKKISYQHYDLQEAKAFNDCPTLRWPSGKPAILNAQTLIEKLDLKPYLSNLEENNRIQNSPPWITNPNLNFNIEWCNTPKKNANPEILKNDFLETYNKTATNKTIIYTDGSLDPKTNENGIGIYIPNTNTNLKYKIQKGPAISSIELYAIQVAIEWATQNNENDIMIISDSKSALQIIQSCNSQYNVVDYIYSQPTDMKITFMWVPSHCTIQGNEIADQLAKTALKDNNTPTKGIIPYKDMLKVIKTKLLNSWIDEWKNGDTGRLLFSIQEQPDQRHPLKLQNRKLESAINRLCCNRAGLNSYRHLIRKINSPDCTTCYVREDSTHYLLHCTKYKAERKTLEENLKDHNIGLSMENILGGNHPNEVTQNEIYAALGNYINQTIGFDILLGKPPETGSPD